jgi:hypothetical protein
VSPSCITVSELSDYIVNDLSVEVLSVFEANTGRFRNHMNFADREVFRECINKHDVERLLVPPRYYNL